LTLREIIADEIRCNGAMPFSRYMELCLYHPELGYYSRPMEQFSGTGDFYTSSDVHAVFGRLLARQFEEMWRATGAPELIDLIELGPGRGLFGLDVLDYCAKKFPDFASALRYGLVEQSAHLRVRLQERLAVHIEAKSATIFDSFETAATQVSDCLIVFANEFFDALPVEVIDARGAVRVAESDGKFAEEFVPSSEQELEFLDRYGVHPEEGGRVEVSLLSATWIERIAAAFQGGRGFAVLIDYGYTREQQLAGRHRDTVMTYRQHRAGFSPYDAPGEQDITAHVNFTALSSVAESHGLEPVALLTQSQFLIGIGEESQFADAFEGCQLPQERAKVTLQLKHLISPEGMGEVFQVLILSRGVDREKAAQLSGLKFLR
jgi:SAM-dependent MidA family methyltransferase